MAGTYDQLAVEVEEIPSYTPNDGAPPMAVGTALDSMRTSDAQQTARIGANEASLTAVIAQLSVLQAQIDELKEGGGPITPPPTPQPVVPAAEATVPLTMGPPSAGVFTSAVLWDATSHPTVNLWDGNPHRVSLAYQSGTLYSTFPMGTAVKVQRAATPVPLVAQTGALKPITSGYLANAIENKVVLVVQYSSTLDALQIIGTYIDTATVSVTLLGDFVLRGSVTSGKLHLLDDAAKHAGIDLFDGLIRSVVVTLPKDFSRTSIGTATTLGIGPIGGVSYSLMQNAVTVLPTQALDRMAELVRFTLHYDAGFGYVIIDNVDLDAGGAVTGVSDPALKVATVGEPAGSPAIATSILIAPPTDENIFDGSAHTLRFAYASGITGPSNWDVPAKASVSFGATPVPLINPSTGQQLDRTRVTDLISKRRELTVRYFATPTARLETVADNPPGTWTPTTTPPPPPFEGPIVVPLSVRQDTDLKWIILGSDNPASHVGADLFDGAEHVGKFSWMGPVAPEAATAARVRVMVSGSEAMLWKGNATSVSTSNWPPGEFRALYGVEKTLRFDKPQAKLVMYDEVVTPPPPTPKFVTMRVGQRPKALPTDPADQSAMICRYVPADNAGVDLFDGARHWLRFVYDTGLTAADFLVSAIVRYYPPGMAETVVNETRFGDLEHGGTVSPANFRTWLNGGIYVAAMEDTGGLQVIYATDATTPTTTPPPATKPGVGVADSNYPADLPATLTSIDDLRLIVHQHNFNVREQDTFSNDFRQSDYVTIYMNQNYNGGITPAKEGAPWGGMVFHCPIPEPVQGDSNNFILHDWKRYFARCGECYVDGVKANQGADTKNLPSITGNLVDSREMHASVRTLGAPIKIIQSFDFSSVLGGETATNPGCPASKVIEQIDWYIAQSSSFTMSVAGQTFFPIICFNPDAFGGNADQYYKDLATGCKNKPVRWGVLYRNYENGLADGSFQAKGTMPNPLTDPNPDLKVFAIGTWGPHDYRYLSNQLSRYNEAVINRKLGFIQQIIPDDARGKDGNMAECFSVTGDVGSWLMLEQWKFAFQKRPLLVQQTTGTDGGECTDHWDNVGRQYVIMDIDKYWGAACKTGVMPPIVREGFYYFHRQNWMSFSKKFSGQPGTWSPLNGGPAPINYFFMLTVLNAPADASITFNGVTKTKQMAAGWNILAADMPNNVSGRPRFKLSRNGGATVIAERDSAFQVFGNPDYGVPAYRAGSSYRPDHKYVLDATPKTDGTGYNAWKAKVANLLA